MGTAQEQQETVAPDADGMRPHSLGSRPAWAIGAASLCTGLNAAYVALHLYTSHARLVSPATALGENLLIVVGFAAAVASWVFLARWMQACARILREDGRQAPPTWKIWASWLIPVYSIGAPFEMMRDLRQPKNYSAEGPVRAWWTGWLLAWVFSQPVATLASDRFADTLSLLGLASLIFSLCWLVHLIREVTALREAPSRPFPRQEPRRTRPAGAEK